MIQLSRQQQQHQQAQAATPRKAAKKETRSGGSTANNIGNHYARPGSKTVERSSSLVRPDGDFDSGVTTHCNSASLWSLPHSSSATNSLSSGSNWMVARFRGPPLLDGRDDLDGRSKSEGIVGLAAAAAAAFSTHEADVPEINIALSANCLTRTAAASSSNNNNHLDAYGPSGCCRCTNEDERAAATDCCNDESSDQFNRRPYLPTSERHKHSSVCAPTRATNNTVACADRWQQANSVPIEHRQHYDAKSRCLAANYDTKLICRDQRYEQPNQAHRVTHDDSSSNNNNKDANSSSIANWQNKQPAKSVTISPVNLNTNHQSASPRDGPLALISSAIETSEEKEEVLAKIEPRQATKQSTTTQLALAKSSQRSNETEVADIEPVVVQGRKLWQLLSQQPQQHPLREESDTAKLQVEIGGLLVGEAQQKQTQQREGAVVARPASEEVMEILQQPNNQDRLITPKTYPNNTLIVDLSKCHRSITHLLPHPTHQALGARSLGTCLKGCWPPLLCPSQSQSRYPGQLGRLKVGGRRSQFSYHMPEPLLRTNVTLKQEEYNRALGVLSSDVRFQLHLLLYRRVQTIWMLLSTILCILVPLLLANLETLMIVGACCLWLGLQIVGAFVTTQFRKKLDQMLEKSVAQVNSYFVEHNLMLGVINVGGLLTKAKLIIPMLYFDTSQCREQIESIISIDSRNDADGNNSDKRILDYTRIDLPLTKPNVMALAQSQLAKKIVLRYSQRWISYFDKRKLMFTDDRIRPRHLSTGKCLCQFIEEHFSNNEYIIKRQQQQQQQHNQAITLNKTTIPIPIDGRPQPQEAAVEEAPVRAQAVRKTAQMAPTIPTLSRLVSLREESQLSNQVRINLDIGQQVAQHKHLTNGWPMPNLCYQNCAVGGKEREQQGVTVNISETPATSPELSLEMGGESISRSDELVRKLRLLLELRKNELQTIDGSLFSGILYKIPQNFTHPTLMPNDNISRPPDNQIADDQSSSLLEVKVDDDTTTTKEGKRFYTQREGGLFLLGSNGAKKIQQDPSRAKHVLEIC